MQTEEEEASSPMMDPWSIFLYGMKAPVTREKYKIQRKLAKFLDFVIPNTRQNGRARQDFHRKGQETTGLSVCKCPVVCPSSEGKGHKERSYLHNNNVVTVIKQYMRGTLQMLLCKIIIVLSCIVPVCR